MKLSDTKVCIIGHGLFELMFGMVMAQDFKEVFFHNPGSDKGADPFPSPFKQWIGENIPGITKANSYEDIKAEILKDKGIFCFFDVGMADKQWDLRQAGGRVYGAGGDKIDGKFMMELLETDRELFKRTLASRGLAVAPWRVVYGIDALVKILKAEKRLWVKMNNSERRIKETFFHEDWPSSVTTVDKLAHDLGFLRDVCFFMIEGEVPGVEPGSDYFYNRGVIFPKGLYGWEKKGDAYLCTVRDVDKLPQAVTKVQQAMAPLYKKHNLCGGISYEVRQGKEKIPYYIDACMRIGNPPGALVSSIYKNLSKIIESIADGKDIEPEFRAPYGAELSIESTEKESVPLEYDVKKDLHKIKLRLATNIKGQYFNVMSNCGTQVVKAIGFGDSMEEAEFECMQAAENFKCKGKTYNKNAFDDLEEDIKTGEKFGLGKF